MAIKVLVVDDSMMMRTIIGDIIKADSDLELVGDAEDGEKGLEKIKELDPDIVLTDIEMPIMDGIEMIKKMKLFSAAKVIVISSVTQIGSPRAMKARALGVYEVIPKPSGTMSLDLAMKRGHIITNTTRRAAGLRGKVLVD